MFPPYDSRGGVGYSFRGGRRGMAAAISGSLHLAAFIALVHAPAVKLPQPSESEYRQSFTGKEQKIVWYKFRRELPHVAPSKTAAASQPLRAENKAEQAIVSAAPMAPARPQMVWTPAPEIRDIAPLESPNLVAVRLPPPPARAFIAPPEPPKGTARAELATPAPRIEPTAIPAVELPEAKLAPRPFSAPVLHRQTPERHVFEPDAPTLAMAGAPVAPDIHVKLAAKPFTAPPEEPKPRAARIAAQDAPVLAASNLAAPSAVLNSVASLAPKPFTAPPRAPSRVSSRSIGAEPAPPVLEANARDLNVAVVGLKPADAPFAPPAASTPANFSAGRDLRRQGASAQADDGALSVPGLYVGKPREKAAPELLAQAFDAPTSMTNLRAAMRNGKPLISGGSGENEETSHSGAVRVSSAPEPRFEGRDIFMMAIQMPNLTSYSGSWLMWYADRTQRVAGLAPIAPPVPHRKVDPKYIPSAVADRVEGKVRLGCVITKEGTVTDVELLRGLDDRLNRTSEEALAKWEFYPATRNGVPVDVDVVVEIPFRLEPLDPKR